MYPMNHHEEPKKCMRSFNYRSNIKLTLIAVLAFLGASSAFAQEFRGLGVWTGTIDMRPVAISSDATVAVGLRGAQDGDRLWRWAALGGLHVGTDLENVRIFHDPASFQVLLSADGSTIAGTGAFPPLFHREAFIWNPTTGLTRLGSLPDARDSGAWRISQDGTVVIGYSANRLDRAGPHGRPWRWTAQTGMHEIIIDPADNFFDFLGMSTDGNTVALRSQSGEGVWRWTTANGLERGGADNGIVFATALSADGGTIVGSARVNGGEEVAWRWVSPSFEIIDNPPGYLTAGAQFVSANGHALVGVSAFNESAVFYGDYDAWRWENGSYTLLPSPAGEARLGELLFVSTDASVILGYTSIYSENFGGQWGVDHSWRWSAQEGMSPFRPLPGYLWTFPTAMSADASLVLGTAFDGTTSADWVWSVDEGMRTLPDDFPTAGLWQDRVQIAVSEDGSTILGSGLNAQGKLEPWIARYRPAILQLGPSFVAANSPGFTLYVTGAGLAAGSKVHWNGIELDTSEDLSGFSNGQLLATVPASLLERANPADLATVSITIVGPTGVKSAPKNFVIMGDQALQENIYAMKSIVAPPGSVSTVSIAPDSPSSSGISATLTVNGSQPASMTVATYAGDPSGSANTSFVVAGQFLDLNASGVTEADSMSAYFYFPPGTDPQNLALKFWNVTSTPAAWENVTPISIDTTLNRIGIIFNGSSHPKITELDGTFFAATHELPIQFTGFLAPISGADAAGGSFAAPVRTFKAGSTIPVKFSATFGGAPVTTGIHRLQAMKYSDATTGGTPIDATPQDAATIGNQFRLVGREWHFNLDTKSTGVTTGIWQLVATLSDGSQHMVWVQIK